MVDTFQPGAFATVAPSFTEFRVALGVVFTIAVTAHLSLGFLCRETLSAWLVDAGETALLIAYFAVVPVVIAVGLYFPLWYSMRQSARVEAITPEPPSPDRESKPSTQAVIVAFVGGTIATFGLAALLATLAPNPLSAGDLLLSGVAFFSVFISIIALPHVVVGSWSDTDRGIWYAP